MNNSTYKFNNIEEMDQLLKKHKLPQLTSPWTTRRSNQSILKEISPGISFGENDAEAETPVLWPPHAKS